MLSTSLSKNFLELEIVVAPASNAQSEEAILAATKSIQMAGSRTIGLAADVTDPRAVVSIVAETVKQLGPVDLLVNNGRPSGEWPVVSWNARIRNAAST